MSIGLQQHGSIPGSVIRDQERSRGPAQGVGRRTLCVQQDASRSKMWCVCILWFGKCKTATGKGGWLLRGTNGL